MAPLEGWKTREGDDGNRGSFPGRLESLEMPGVRAPG
jgi:hypothetical protein